MAQADDYNIDLSAICVRVDCVSMSASCAEVYDLFANDARLPAVPIVDAEMRPVGLAHRHGFLLALADMFGRPLSEKKPVTRLMDGAPLVIERKTALGVVSKQMHEWSSGAATANFIVVDNGRFYAIASIGGLLRVVTDHLLDQSLAAEASQREAEAAASGKSRFLANMTHELRTPLNGVIGFGQLLLSEAHGPLGAEEYKLYAKDIVDSGQHLVSIINDILDLAKLEAGRVELHERFVDLRELVGRSTRMVATLAADKQIRVANRFTQQQMTLRADERRLQQAIVNLLSNAIKFTPNGSEVGIDCGVVGEAIWIEVWDTGCGIAEADLRRLFKPFQQLGAAPASSQPGTGLGLTITKALMHAHGGDVMIESRLGLGTRAKLLLPRDRLLSDEFAWSAESKVEFIDPPEVEAG